MATYEDMEVVEQLLFKDKVNEALDNLNKIGRLADNFGF